MPWICTIPDEIEFYCDYTRNFNFIIEVKLTFWYSYWKTYPIYAKINSSISPPLLIFTCFAFIFSMLVSHSHTNHSFWNKNTFIHFDCSVEMHKQISGTYLLVSFTIYCGARDSVLFCMLDCI